MHPPVLPDPNLNPNVKASRIRGVLRTEHPAHPQVGKLTFTLEVLDVNDNAPEFPNTIYTRTVSEVRRGKGARGRWGAGQARLGP